MQALTDVDFEVRSGEVMALVGDNGAGKSTLIKCVAGIHRTTSGEIFFDGKKVSIHGPKDAAQLGIEVVYQDLALCDNLDVVQNMYLGREEHDVHPAPQGARDGGEDGREDEVARRHDDPLDPAAGREPLRRPAPVGRGREAVHVELAARDPRRADGGARRRADRQVLELVKRLAHQGSRSSSSRTTCTTSSRSPTGSRCSASAATSRVYERDKTTQQEVVQAITAGVPTKVAGITGHRRGG